jgi:hypothetical protein
MFKVGRAFGIFTCLLALVTGCFSQDRNSDQDSGRIGVGVNVSTLGLGAEMAARMTQRTNIRGGFNAFSLSRGFSKDGVNYSGEIDFRNLEGHLDIFPSAGAFHVSPGFVAYIGDPVTATAGVPAGQSFTLGGVSYYSDTSSPAHGSGKIDVHRAAPMITVGWGNLIPRKAGKHLSFPFEIGVAFQGSPHATVNLAGHVCILPGTGCRSASDPTVQTNLRAEQTKINHDLSFLKVYPIISTGIAYKF